MKKNKIKRQSKEPVAKLKRECMAIAKRIVSIRDNDTCQKCEVRVFGSNRQRSHVIPVSAGNKLAFDPLNMKILCYHHHINWWHKNPREAADWFREKFPERDKYLTENQGILKMKYLDWIELKEKLNKELEIML